MRYVGIEPIRYNRLAQKCLKSSILANQAVLHRTIMIVTTFKFQLLITRNTFLKQTQVGMKGFAPIQSATRDLQSRAAL